ncbi:MAG: diadenylate cyclase CdaA [Bacteroidales bacterium]|nr:diadenylate cyclase CdaA [Candidatus Colicola faecequi]
MPSIGISDIIDILLVASIMYGFFSLLRHTGAANLFWGILVLAVAGFVVGGIFHLEMTGALLNSVFSAGILGLIVIFQEELRGFIYRIGSKMNVTDLRRRFVQREEKQAERYVGQITIACNNMAKTSTGALIVLEGEVQLREYADTGEPLDAQVSARLIENIFFKNTPLHDGALILSKGRLQAAGCILPVSKDATIPQHYGLRHRAALGLAEKTDALCIIVSEETGRISVAQDATIREVGAQGLTGIITDFLTKK